MDSPFLVGIKKTRESQVVHSCDARSTLLLGELLEADALELGGGSLGTLRHDLTTPVATDLVGALVVVRVDGLDELAKSGAVLGVDVGEGDARAVLEADETTQSALALDDAVGDSHAAAQGWEEENDLDGVDVVGDDDQLGLLLLDLDGHVVDTDRHEVWLLVGLIGTTGGPKRGLS